MDSSDNDYGEDVLGYPMSEQPQEWTEKRLHSMWSERYGDTPPPIRFIDDLIREQNEFRARSQKHLGEMSEQPQEWKTNEQIAREAAEELNHYYDKLLGVSPEPYTDLTFFTNTILAAIEKATKPLVDALEQVKELLDRYNDEIRPAIATLNDIKSIVFDVALAKVKPYPLPDGPTNRGRLRS